MGGRGLGAADGLQWINHRTQWDMASMAAKGGSL